MRSCPRMLRSRRPPKGRPRIPGNRMRPVPRGGVPGANDGIVSVAGIVVGVAGATSARGPIFTAGLAGLVAGAVSMALGEYVSVSSQRDSERAEISQEKRELADTPEAELTELIALYEAKGLSAATARTVAAELTARGA